MNNIDKKTIIYILTAVIISALAGFYIGRYYERTAARKRFGQMQIRGSGNFQGRPGNFRTQENRQVPPTGQPTPTPEQPNQPVQNK